MNANQPPQPPQGPQQQWSQQGSPQPPQGPYPTAPQYVPQHAQPTNYQWPQQSMPQGQQPPQQPVQPWPTKMVSQQRMGYGEIILHWTLGIFTGSLSYWTWTRSKLRKNRTVTTFR